MEPINPPKTFKVYTLIKQSGLNLSYTASSTLGMSLGLGFFWTQTEAEHHRTMELLKDTTMPKSQYHVFELDIPNPAYSE